MFCDFKYQFFLPEQLQITGWLRRQLEVQAAGLNGNLDRIWPDIYDSKWVGGNCEGWERVPYWLDGFGPLGALLGDEDIIRRTKYFVDSIIAHQQPDGWLCPCPADERPVYDTWGNIIILKALISCEFAIGDQKLEEVVSRALKQFAQHIAEYPLFNWGKFRWFEALIPILWLYRRNPEEWLLNLVETLHQQGFDYQELFKDFPYKKKSVHWEFESHVVNLAMALKAEALYSCFNSGANCNFPEKMLATLQQYHGNCYEGFSGDECVAGNSAIQGTELCAIVESMYSCEILLSQSGNPKWADRLEKLAFNALPATNDAAMQCHQYVQQPNQIGCAVEGVPVWSTNSGEANLFGFEPNYGCCTANFGQGWPKIAHSTFLRSTRGVFSAIPIPSTVKFEMNSAEITCALETDYPFGNLLKYTITTTKEVEFELEIRIPGSVESAIVNGEKVAPGEIYSLFQAWCGISEVEVVLNIVPKMVERPRQMYCVNYGNLLYSLPIAAEERRIEYVRNNFEHRYPYCDYEFLPAEPWNYAFYPGALEVSRSGAGFECFKHGTIPISITANMVKVNWQLQENTRAVCRNTPENNIPVGGIELRTLIPYGFSTLRLTEMPMAAQLNSE